MNDEKINFDHPLAILINNTCNLTCNNCATAQCYNFEGVYSWKDEAHFYEKWSSIIDVPAIDILGGEPYLHPELFEWATNIKRLWPNARVSVETNGTLLFLEKNISLTRKLLDNEIGLLVSTHKTEDFVVHENYIKEILKPYMDLVEIAVSEDNKEIEYSISDVPFVHHSLIDMMHKNYIREIKNGVLYLSNGDPIINHENCFSSTECFTIQRGLLYKCPLVLNYAEAKNQINYEQSAKELLDQYVPCSPYDDIIKIKQHIDNIINPIPQCALCPFDKIESPREILYPVTFDKTWKKAFNKI